MRRGRFSIVFVVALLSFLAASAPDLKRTRTPRFPASFLGSSFPAATADSLPAEIAEAMAQQTAGLPPYQTHWFAQDVDHFGFYGDNEASMLWNQRYLVADQYYTGAGAPLVFYTGNEGDIGLFYNNTGFAFTIAQELGALVIFAEHRYYGLSMPFGAHSFDADKVGFLTTEQAMADYATMLVALKPQYKFGRVLAVGGSYGGMLAFQVRYKYPHIWHAALAASAPILEFMNVPGYDYGSFNAIIANDYSKANPQCTSNLRAAFKQVVQMGATQAGLEQLRAKFRICDPLPSAAALVSWMENAFGNMAMIDYPYPANFLMPVPAWPIAASCQANLAAPDVLTGLFDTLMVYYNYTGLAGSCNNLTTTSTNALGDAGWNYQACTEMVMPQTADMVHDFFPPMSWDYNAYKSACYATYGSYPRPFWYTTNFGGWDISSASNIIFSNGLLDPWSGGGMTKTLKEESLVAILIADGAHHLDLRTPHPNDPDSVVKARAEELRLIKKWMTEP